MFYGEFDCKLDICNRFEIDESVLADCTILFAAYACGGYEGSALVIFQRDQQLYEVNGSHCSCYGLVGQWDPEATTVEALSHRIEKGTLGSDLGCFEEGFRTMLDRLSRKGESHQS